MQKKVSDFLFKSSGFLILGTLLALVWANLAHESYEGVHHVLHFVVNDIGMAFFFLLVGKEVYESIFLKNGALKGRERASLPIVAVIGGMAVPAGIYILAAVLFDKSDLVGGWAIPCATDIAFSLMVLKFIYHEGKAHPAVIFLMAVAILDDFGGLALIALFYSPTPPNFLIVGGLVGAGLLLGYILRTKFHVRSFWAYLILTGVPSWLGFYFGGLHAALGLLPVIFVMPHAESDLGIFAKEELNRHDTLNEMEHFFKAPVEVVLFFFGLVNAGVVMSSFGIPTAMVGGALIIGKLVGIGLFTVLGVKVLNMRLPERVTLGRDLPVLAMAAAIGFTVALFVAIATGIKGEDLDALKMGALLSFGAFPLTYIMAKIFKVGKFSIKHADITDERTLACGKDPVDAEA